MSIAGGECGCRAATSIMDSKKGSMESRILGMRQSAQPRSRSLSSQFVNTVLHLGQNAGSQCPGPSVRLHVQFVSVDLFCQPSIDLRLGCYYFGKPPGALCSQQLSYGELADIWFTNSFEPQGCRGFRFGLTYWFDSDSKERKPWVAVPLLDADLSQTER